MDKKYLDYFMEHFYKEDLPPRELVGAAALFERMYTNTAQLLIGENYENSCSFCGAKWTIKSDGNLVWPPSNRKISIYCPMCGRHFVTKDLDDIMKEEKAEFHCGVEESGGHAYNCNDCPNKCEEWHQWDKEFKEAKNENHS